MTRSFWTETEDQRLTEFYRDKVCSVEISAALGRTRGSIHSRAVILGLAQPAQRGEQNPLWIAIKSLCADGKARTVVELIALTGAKEKNIERLMHVRRAKSEAHIAGYEPVPHGTSRPLWLPFPGEDVLRPPPSARALRQRLWRARSRDEESDGAVEAVRRPNLPAPRRIGGVQHEIVRALFGMGVSA